MNIGVITNLYPPMARGGAELVAQRIVQELHLRGHKVFVISTKPYDGLSSLAPAVTDQSIEKVYRFYPFNLYHQLNDHRYPFAMRALWHLTDLWSPHAARAVGSILEKEQPDVVLTHNLKGIGLGVAAEIRRRGIRHVHTIHDVQLSVPSGLLLLGEEDSFLNRSVFRKWYERRVQQMIGSPDVVVSPSQFLASFYRQRHFFPKSRVEVLANPAPNLTPQERTEHAPGPVRLLYAGQLATHKGVLFLLRALNTLDIPFQLHIAGEGKLTPEVTAWAQRDQRVMYHGFCSLSNLTKLFAISDAVVVPSLCYENSPTVIYESFRAGVPVVAADIGGVGELVRDGDNGYLFRPGDEEGLRSAVRRIATEEHDFRSHADRIRASMEQHALATYVETLEGFMQNAPKENPAQ